MLRLENPPGVPNTDTARVRQVGCLREARALASIPEEERSAIVESLGKTLRRSEYHYQRLLDLRRSLDIRRDGLPGEVFWDPLIETVHFELQAFCGASRMAVDELLYVIARRHGVAEAAARKKPWESSDLIALNLIAGSECDVAEIRRLRRRGVWFATLNAYRNSFFHHGWRHGSGHFGETEGHAAARSPAANGLLLPDQSSLKKRSKPHEWTWTTGQTVDSVVRAVREGLDAVIGELCEDEWGTPVPPPGTAPEERRFNLLVTLAKPAVLVSDSAVIVPFFSTEGAGRAFMPFREAANLELVRVRTSAVVAGTSAITFSLHGLEPKKFPATVSSIDVYLDPRPTDIHWTRVEAAGSGTFDLQTLMRAGTHEPLSLPIEGFDSVFVWREALSREWL